MKSAIEPPLIYGFTSTLPYIPVIATGFSARLSEWAVIVDPVILRRHENMGHHNPHVDLLPGTALPASLPLLHLKDVQPVPVYNEFPGLAVEAGFGARRAASMSSWASRSGSCLYTHSRSMDSR